MDYAAAAEASAAAAMRLISADIRVLGEAYVRLWFPAPDAAVGSDAVATPTPRLGLPPPRVQSVSSRRTSTHVGSRHQREVAIDKEMAAAPNVLSVTRTRDALARHISKLPVDFGGAF